MEKLVIHLHALHTQRVCFTFTALAVLLQYVTSWAGAHVSSLDILTYEVAWFRSLGTLVHICKDTMCV